jgi:hypothetical protein
MFTFPRKPAGLLAALLTCLTGGTANAANHREAPLTALDSKADITDFFAFVSYDNPGRATLILNVDPLLEPGNGPNYFPFDPDIVYAIRIDNNHDAVADVVIEFTFNTEIRAPGVFTGFVGAGQGVNAPASAPLDMEGKPTAGTPLIPPAITDLDGDGAAGLSLRQNYTVWLKKRVGTKLNTVFSKSNAANGDKLIAVPSNVGPRTMPNYPQLAARGIYDLGDGIKVFAGTVDDPFWIDLGAAFDSFNFRSVVGGGLGVLSAEQDSSAVNVAPDDVAGYNVNTVAVELPIAMLTADGKTHDATDPMAVLGTWGSTWRPKTKNLSPDPKKPDSHSNAYVQVQRMGNPLFNELIIGTGSKDLFSRSQPRDDGQFAGFALDPLLARVFNAVTGGALVVPNPPRLDLLPLVQYRPPICPGCTTEAQMGPVADLLRLNTGIPQTAPESMSRLGVLGGDLGGFPNGRRVGDDVLDIAARVVAGGVLAAPFDGYNSDVNGRLGDGVNSNDVPYRKTFPYVAFAQSGRDSRHVDPGESKCTMGKGAACAK